MNSVSSLFCSSGGMPYLDLSEAGYDTEHGISKSYGVSALKGDRSCFTVSSGTTINKYDDSGTLVWSVSPGESTDATRIICLFYVPEEDMLLSFCGNGSNIIAFVKINTITGAKGSTFVNGHGKTIANTVPASSMQHWFCSYPDAATFVAVNTNTGVKLTANPGSLSASNITEEVITAPDKALPVTTDLRRYDTDATMDSSSKAMRIKAYNGVVDGVEKTFRYTSFLPNSFQTNANIINRPALVPWTNSYFRLATYGSSLQGGEAPFEFYKKDATYNAFNRLFRDIGLPYTMYEV